MRRLFVTMMFALAFGLAGTAVQADNQAAANKIAQELGAKYPQYNIEVAYQDGLVRLRGSIATESERAEIKRHVEMMPQVKNVSETFTIVSRQEKNLMGQTATPSSYLPNQSLSTPTVIDQGRVLAVAGEKPVLNAPVLSTEPIKTTVNKPIEATTSGKVTARNAGLRSDVSSNMPVLGEFPLNTQAANAQPQMLPVPKVQMVGNNATKAVPIAPATPIANPTIAQEFAPHADRPIGTPIAGQMQAYPTQQYAGPQGQPMVPGQMTQPNMPNNAWPTYANYPNYSQVSYPKQYGAGAFPYIGPFYPYPQVPLGWRKVTMEWHDGYWWLDFNDGSSNGPFSPLFRTPTNYR